MIVYCLVTSLLRILSSIDMRETFIKKMRFVGIQYSESDGNVTHIPHNSMIVAVIVLIFIDCRPAQPFSPS